MIDFITSEETVEPYSINIRYAAKIELTTSLNGVWESTSYKTISPAIDSSFSQDDWIGLSDEDRTGWVETTMKKWALETVYLDWEIKEERWHG